VKIENEEMFNSLLSKWILSEPKPYH